MKKAKWYNKWGYLILWSLLFYPVAVYGVIRTNLISKKIKIGFVSFFVLITGIIFIHSNIEQNKILEYNEKMKEKFVSKLDNETNLENKLFLCDSIIRYSSSDSVSNYYGKLKDTIYYNLHTFELSDTNFINRSKYYTSHTESVNFKTKTITYRKDFVSTELYVYKEVIRKSIKYFTEFPSLDEINFILYSNENGNKFISNVKRKDIEYIFDVNWDSLRIGKPTASGFGYNIEKEMFKVAFNKNKLTGNKYKLYLDRNKYGNYINFIKSYNKIDDSELSVKLKLFTESIVTTTETIEYYNPQYSSWSEHLFISNKNKWINYENNLFGVNYIFKSKNAFGVYMKHEAKIKFKLFDDGSYVIIGKSVK